MIMIKEAIILLIMSVFLTAGTGNGELLNPSNLAMFVDEVPNMPRLQGFDIRNGAALSKSLQIGMFMKTWKFHRDLPPTTVFAYGTFKDTATVPGPTIEAIQGVSTYVTWLNYLPAHHILPWDPTLLPMASPPKGVPTVVHLHGGIDEPQSDGNPNAWFTSGFEYKGSTWFTEKYHYDNMQHPGNLWYHDHAIGMTRINLLAGLLGSYIIRNPDLEIPMGLPHGNEFDQPLFVFDRSFNTDGSIYENATGNNPTIHPQWRPETFGDVIIVNGKAWPHLTVGRRKYRFRIINACSARFLQFYLTNGLSFINLASDSAYLHQPVVLSKLLLAPSEIADVIIDFSKSSTNQTILANDAPFPYPTGATVDQFNGQVMKFIIEQLRKDEVDTSHVPSTLIKYPTANILDATKTRYITMYEYTSNTNETTHLYLNGVAYEAPVTETPKPGTTEVWNVINLTVDDHPLHIHLGLFTVLEQRRLVNFDNFTACMLKINDAIKCQVEMYRTGSIIGVPSHECGWKNVFKIEPGTVTKILVKFSFIHSNASYKFDATSEPGYVYHCHILDHEDNAMMRPLKFIS